MRVPRGTAAFAACSERWGRAATRGGVQAPQNSGRLELRQPAQAARVHKLRGSYGQVGKLRAPCFAPGSLPTYLVARPRRLRTRKGRRACLLSVVICSGTRHRRALRALTTSHQPHRSNYGTKRIATHDHSPSHGCSPAPSATAKKTDTPQSHGDRQHSKAHHPF